MTMFRAEMLCSDEFYFQVLKRFAALPEHESLVGHISKEKGEDRWLTLLLIEMADKMVPKRACALICYCAALRNRLFVPSCFIRLCLSVSAIRND
jgi:hypothetical protein